MADQLKGGVVEFNEPYTFTVDRLEALDASYIDGAHR